MGNNSILDALISALGTSSAQASTLPSDPLRASGFDRRRLGLPGNPPIDGPSDPRITPDEFANPNEPPSIFPTPQDPDFTDHPHNNPREIQQPEAPPTLPQPFQFIPPHIGQQERDELLRLFPGVSSHERTPAFGGPLDPNLESILKALENAPHR